MLFDSDACTDILDAELTSAEDALKALLSRLKPAEISQAFANQIYTHLSTELSNVAVQGHPDPISFAKSGAKRVQLVFEGAL
jgi:hypothetical protein